MGQSIISAGLVIIVTMAVINANRLIINADVSKMEALARIQAADIAMALITEARMKRFDENAIDTRYQSTSEFTSASSLGRESGEWAGNPDGYPYNSADMFDDFDDYDGYRRAVNTTSLSGFDVNCVVYYATRYEPDVEVSSIQYFKTLEVYISHSLYLPNAIRISITKSY